MTKAKYVSQVSAIPGLSAWEVAKMERVTRQYPFVSNSYYLGLIDWEDKADPIRRLIVPCADELADTKWGALDPSNESYYKATPGIQHKYGDTALFFVSNSCFGHCRYCFRKRIFMGFAEDETAEDTDLALDYITEHTEINNVLLTGGDPLTLSTDVLGKIISELRKIDHVKVIRIGTKSVVFNPQRIINDKKLPKMIRRFSTPERRLYFMLHFCHPNEITPEAIKAVNILLSSGAVLCNQTPLVRGVNDDPEVLAALCKELSYIGVVPYYFFQVRPTVGNKPYTVPLVRAYKAFQESQNNISGTAKRARFVMSHETGKIEIIGLDEKNIYMKYHRAPGDGENGAIITARRNEWGYWLEDFNVYPLGVDSASYCAA